MNDRFKFRVWDKEEHQYLKPSFFDSIWFDKDGGIRVGCYSDIVGKVVDYTNEVDIEQCTGLKDKNGKLIYEGDIVADGCVKRTVMWNGWYWNAKARTNCPLDNITCSIVEIVGNIHEQAEQKE